MPKHMNYDAQELALIEASGKLNQDAGETIFFARELDAIKAKSYDVKYAPYTAFDAMPVEFSANAGAETITYYQYDGVGMAKIIANYADDLPRADVNGKPFTSPVKSIGNSYGYNIQEIRAAAMGGKPLQQMKANRARMANDAEVNRIAWKGDAASGLQGLLTHPNIPSYTIPGGKTWNNVTGDEAIDALNGMVQSMIASTGGVEMPDTVAMPPALKAKLASMRLSGENYTVLKFWLENNGYVSNVIACPELAGADNGKDVVIVYRKSPDVFTLEIPAAYEQLPPEARNLEFVVNCHSRCGGVIVYYPLALIKAA